LHILLLNNPLIGSSGEIRDRHNKNHGQQKAGVHGLIDCMDIAAAVVSLFFQVKIFKDI
jgi:hypothetical protein